MIEVLADFSLWEFFYDRRGDKREEQLKTDNILDQRSKQLRKIDYPKCLYG